MPDLPNLLIQQGKLSMKFPTLSSTWPRAGNAEQGILLNDTTNQHERAGRILGQDLHHNQGLREFVNAQPRLFAEFFREKLTAPAIGQISRSLFIQRGMVS